MRPPCVGEVVVQSAHGLFRRPHLGDDGVLPAEEELPEGLDVAELLGVISDGSRAIGRLHKRSNRLCGRLGSHLTDQLTFLVPVGDCLGPRVRHLIAVVTHVCKDFAQLHRGVPSLHLRSDGLQQGLRLVPPHRVGPVHDPPDQQERVEAVGEYPEGFVPVAHEGLPHTAR